MKKILIILSAFFLTACSEKINDYYAGFVVDELGRPVEGVWVIENTDTEPLKTQTDEHGFLKLTRNKGIICHLKIEKDGYKSETFSTFLYHAKNQEDGWFEYSSFLTSDTTKTVLQKLNDNNERKIKYVFKSEDGCEILFFDDGYAWEWESKTLEFPYKENLTHLVAGKNSWSFFDSLRRVATGWEIFNYQKMEPLIETPIEIDNNYVYEIYQVEQYPEFPGGLPKFLHGYLTYPTMYEDFDIVGRVVSQFIIEKDGSVSNTEIIESLHPNYDREVLRIIKQMPRWMPAKINGKTVRVYYLFPVFFNEERNKTEK